MKNKLITGLVFLAVITLVSGVTILALASPGTPEDPLISLSYLTSIFMPRVMEDVTRVEQELTRNFNEQIAALEAQLQASQSGAPAAPDPADVFTVVTLRRNQSLTCSVGTEIMLRVGTANGFGTAPALVNYTTGNTLSSGTALTVNHMYLITIEGNGVTATADNVRVLVRGTYSISG